MTMSAKQEGVGVTVQESDAEHLGLFLAEQRRIIGQRVMGGASGAETLAAMTELVDGLIVGRYREAVRHGGEALANAGLRQCCVMALGGYGRRELAPHSDIDLMFLYLPGAEDAAKAFARAVLHPLWDCGFQVGHSVRTIADSGRDSQDLDDGVEISGR